MKTNTEMFLTALKVKYSNVIDLGLGHFFVEWAEEEYLHGGIYSREEMKIVCSCSNYRVLTQDLITLVSITHYGYYGQHRSYKYQIYSRKRKRLIDFGNYSVTSPFSPFWVYIMTSFRETKKSVDENPPRNLWGIFNAADESFVIHPEYTMLTSLGNNQYYGIKKDASTGKEVYFLIEINEKGKVTTQETNKLA